MNYGGSHLGLDVVTDYGYPPLLELFGPLWVRDYEGGHGVDEGDPSLKAGLGVEPRRLFRTHGNVVDQDVSLGLLEDRNHILQIVLLLVRKDEGSVLRVVLHVGGKTVQDLTHADLDSHVGYLWFKDSGTVGRSEYSL